MIRSIKFGLILAPTLAFLGCAHIQTWDKKDMAMLALCEVLTFVDYRQTREIAKHPERYFEKYNSILGEEPGTGDVDRYFLCSALVKAVVAGALPKNENAWFGLLGRESWLMVNIGLSVGMVGNNWSVGIGVNF